MDERKRQLEEKKQKLAALKEKKRAAEEAKKEKLLAHMEKRGERPSATGATGSTSAKEEEVADILLGVGVDPSPQKLPAPEKDSRDASPAPTMRFSASRPTTLSVSQNVQVNIAPKETVAYSKTTQTVGEEGGGLRSGLSIGGTPSHDYEWEEDGFGDGGLKMGGSRKHARAGTMDEGSEVESDLSPTAHVPPELAGLVSSIIRSAEGGTVVGEETKEESPVEEKRLELSEEEKAKIMAEASFQDYFAQAIGLLDRAAANPYDKYVFREIMPDAGAKVDSGAKISLAHSFTHPLAEKKYVMGLEFSETHPELVAVAYGDEGDDFISHHGSHILVWNVKLPNKATPEHIFHSTSKVTSVAWSKFHPHLLIGGTYSGQICVWDRRQAKKTPAQRSPLSANAHTHPVYGLKVVGTQNANNLVSLSKDGRLCTWSLDMVAQPLQVIDLTAKQSRQVLRHSATESPMGDFIRQITTHPSTPASCLSLSTFAFRTGRRHCAASARIPSIRQASISAPSPSLTMSGSSFYPLLCADPGDSVLLRMIDQCEFEDNPSAPSLLRFTPKSKANIIIMR